MGTNPLENYLELPTTELQVILPSEDSPSIDIYMPQHIFYKNVHSCTIWFTLKLEVTHMTSLMDWDIFIQWNSINSKTDKLCITWKNVEQR